MSISNAYDMGLLSRTFQVNNIFKVYLYICTHNKPSRFIFSNSNIRHVIASLVFQSRTATIQIQKNRGAIEIRFVSVSSHIPASTQISHGSDQIFETFTGLYDRGILLECVVKVPNKSSSSLSPNRVTK